MVMVTIESVKAEQIFDSRGAPTIKTTIFLSDGTYGSASVPSGTSIGVEEAAELRDKDGSGVTEAIKNVEGEIFQTAKNIDVFDQERLDRAMISLDGTKNKSRFGANAILSVSLAAAAAAAGSRQTPLYSYLRLLTNMNEDKFRLPTPMANLIEGGKHANNKLNFQEYLAIPKKQKTFEESFDSIKKIIKILKSTLIEEGLSVGQGMEGGFAPKLGDDEAAIELLEDSIKKGGFSTDQFGIGLDMAAGSFLDNSKDREGHINFLVKLSEKHNLYSLEDPLGESDWGSWKQLREKLRGKRLIIGDDLTVTNVNKLREAIEVKAIDGAVVKPNQIGSLTETLGFVKKAKDAGLTLVVSHRSGETEDTFIADLAVGVNAEFVKIGAPTQKERLVKYKRLIEIEKNIKNDEKT